MASWFKHVQSYFMERLSYTVDICTPLHQMHKYICIPSTYWSDLLQVVLEEFFDTRIQLYPNKLGTSWAQWTMLCDTLYSAQLQYTITMNVYHVQYSVCWAPKCSHKFLYSNSVSQKCTVHVCYYVYMMHITTWMWIITHQQLTLVVPGSCWIAPSRLHFD